MNSDFSIQIKSDFKNILKHTGESIKVINDLGEVLEVDAIVEDRIYEEARYKVFSFVKDDALNLNSDNLSAKGSSYEHKGAIYHQSILKDNDIFIEVACNYE